MLIGKPIAVVRVTPFKKKTIELAKKVATKTQHNQETLKQKRRKRYLRPYLIIQNNSNLARTECILIKMWTHDLSKLSYETVLQIHLQWLLQYKTRIIDILQWMVFIHFKHHPNNGNLQRSYCFVQRSINLTFKNAWNVIHGILIWWVSNP